MAGIRGNENARPRPENNPERKLKMVDRNTVNMAQNAAASAREAANQGYDSAREYAGKGYDAAREYASNGMDVAARVSEDLRDFVRREPWIAIAAAFAVGYVVARVMRKVSL
jgi:ElaB/YqjD/DUF883 family membrane-anchored ribosome-binding protein